MDSISTEVKQETDIYTNKLITACKEVTDEVVSNISKSYVELNYPYMIKYQCDNNIIFFININLTKNQPFLFIKIDL